MHYARSENNVVSQVLRVHPSTVYFPEMAVQFRPCAEEVQVGWLDDGAAFSAPPPPPSPVPAAITMRQARLVLLSYGLLDDVDPAIAQIPDETTRRAAQIEWEFSNELQRSNAFVLQLAPALGLTEDQVDTMFRVGATL